MPTACPAMGTCFWFARSEDSNRATAPQRRNQQSGGLLVSPRESPRGMRQSAGPDGGSLTESVGLFFIAIIRDKEKAVGSRPCSMSLRQPGILSWCRRTRTAAEATAACGGNREPKQGQRPQRRRPPKGRQPMRAPQPVQCPPSAPAGKKAPAQLCGGMPARSGHCAGLHHFSALSTSAPTVDAGSSAITAVWSYVGTLAFNLLVRVGAVKGCDRIVKGDHGGVRVLLFVGFLWYNCVTRRWLVCLQSFPSVI